ncbi:MAG: hypothetical protein CVV64_13485 [Candidatus Wallbacteria bacterium HGW-Wallbacteria-1]|jgi:SAM-dependent methyltransferase|uniref:Methyltransferase domain-containing protein n=1 Tax=Candidatus Wallbacteria bacterium HGW-Wallbacteria-1 TaxID=2013854 RepID=A0A2N1PMK5_9BACT|nr:MAG: hypothetical protein CVV64_13485 [Candidatus Wallbacteria bacterium HGW-Wallbacteria-1]
MKNPHFDEGLLVWDDSYTGRYSTPRGGYGEQFDLQWNQALRRSDYFVSPGASTEDEYIRDRVLEITGTRPGGGGYHDSTCASRILDNPIDPELIRGKKCIDIGCGLGRWTRTMQMIGAESVLSVDMSESGLENVSKFNSEFLRADIMKLTENPKLEGVFDFAIFWGVAMCTHDPLKAFRNAAYTVAPGGSMYLMVYGPEGMHNTAIVNLQRRIFHALTTVQERLDLVETVYDRKWDSRFPLMENIKNRLRNILGRSKGSRVGVLDMLEPFYNWTVSMKTIESWMASEGFQKVVRLNSGEKRPCAYHVLGMNKGK